MVVAFKVRKDVSFLPRELLKSDAAPQTLPCRIPPSFLPRHLATPPFPQERKAFARVRTCVRPNAGARFVQNGSKANLFFFAKLVQKRRGASDYLILVRHG